MDKKVIIFDFDGVILDSRRKAFSLLKKSYPKISESQIEGLFSGNIFQELAKLGEPAIALEDLQKEWKEILSVKSEDINLVDGIKNLLETLSKDFILFINTASNAESVISYLSNHDSYYFKGVYGSETSKSKVEKFNLIFKSLNVSSSQCIFVTDTVGDALEAREVNVDTVLVSWGYQSVEAFNLSHVKAFAVVENVEQLKGCLVG